MAQMHSSRMWGQNRQRSRGPSRREVYLMLVYAILMLVAILGGMYLGWWSLLREEEQIERPAPARSKADPTQPRSYLR
jgi:hypothetical protein